MRLSIGILTVAFAAAFGSVTSAKAQYCAPVVCANPWQTGGKAARAKPNKVTAKKQKKPAKERYMRVAP